LHEKLSLGYQYKAYFQSKPTHYTKKYLERY
jgi:hypothetical protein